ncbi:ABC transporter permease [Pseudonocardia ailaonensis]|uniref:ABC transporter permease n=1 Tax=Pseudonocardia ailaonensis TaxID=367279 RepID=A0ABN2NP39_9PSEU
MNRVAALTFAELKLIVRNRTLLVSTLIIPLGLGLFITFTGGVRDAGPYLLAMQLVFVLGMGIYVSATQTLVARRQSQVLKRLRTSGISDSGLVTATIAPTAILALVQFVVFAIFDVAAGVPLPSSPWLILLALVGGLALVITAALATTIVTPAAERAQITTLPLFFVMIGTGIVLAILPLEGWFQALALLPGGMIGTFVQASFGGGFPLLALVSLVLWPVLFGMLARRHFRWDARA